VDLPLKIEDVRVLYSGERVKVKKQKHMALSQRKMKAATTPRPGRPSTPMAGKVDERLLDAATQVFMNHGYECATFEKIAQTAGSGKATI